MKRNHEKSCLKMKKCREGLQLSILQCMKRAESQEKGGLLDVNYFDNISDAQQRSSIEKTKNLIPYLVSGRKYGLKFERGKKFLVGEKQCSILKTKKSVIFPTLNFALRWKMKSKKPLISLKIYLDKAKRYLVNENFDGLIRIHVEFIMTSLLRPFNFVLFFATIYTADKSRLLNGNDNLFFVAAVFVLYISSILVIVQPIDKLLHFLKFFLFMTQKILTVTGFLIHEMVLTILGIFSL